MFRSLTTMEEMLSRQSWGKAVQWVQWLAYGLEFGSRQRQFSFCYLGHVSEAYPSFLPLIAHCMFLRSKEARVCTPHLYLHLKSEIRVAVPSCPLTFCEWVFEKVQRELQIHAHPKSQVSKIYMFSGTPLGSISISCYPPSCNFFPISPLQYIIIVDVKQSKNKHLCNLRLLSHWDVMQC
jgi:hypothetical protein